MRVWQPLGPFFVVVMFAVLAAAVPLAWGGSGLPPDINVTPASFSLSLRQGDSAVRAVTIQNKGAGVLNWDALIEGIPSWVALDVSSGALPPKTSQIVKLTFAAGVLDAGSFSSSLKITTNDPDTPTLQRPISFKVTSAPVTALAPPALAFDTTFVGGRSRGYVTVTNGGDAPLSIGGTLPLSTVFVCVEKLPATVAPGASRTIAIEFRPVAEGKFNGNVVFTDNTAKQFFYVPASGGAIFGPTVKATPASVSQTLNPGVITTQSIEVSNVGKGRTTLVWTAEIESPTPQKFASLAAGSGGRLAAGAHVPLVVNIDTFALEAGSYPLKVLIRSNDPVRPELRVPLTLRVNKLGVLTVSPTSVAIPSAIVGLPEDRTLALTNAGNVAVTISNVLSSATEIRHGFVEERTLVPGEVWDMPVRFTSSTPGNFSGSLTIQTTDKRIMPVVVSLTAASVRPAAIAINPDHITRKVSVGGVVSDDLTISNSGEASLNWNAVLQNVTPAVQAQSSLSEVLQNLDAKPTVLPGAVSSRYDFSGGLTGSSISGGGDHMYDVGNTLSTNLAALPYSNGIVTPHAAVGAGGLYFTRKQTGMFILAADLVGVSRLRVAGNLGADGIGTASGVALSRTVAGISYKGFFKRVYGAGVPSVNHLFIVADATDRVDSFNSNTNSDQHDLNGLYAASTRVYYLLFATTDGGFVSDAAAAEVMRVFLETIAHPTTTAWLRINAASGTTAGGAASSEKVTIDTSKMLPGAYSGSVRFTSNALVSSTVVVPVSLTVLATPDNLSGSPVASADTSDGGGGSSEWLMVTRSRPDQLIPPESLSRRMQGGTAASQMMLSQTLVRSLAALLPPGTWHPEFPVSSGVAGSGLTMDVDGDGVADASALVRRSVLQGRMGWVEVISYTRRKGVDDALLALEASKDEGQNWTRLAANADYKVELDSALDADIIEVVTVSIPHAAGALWSYRLIGAKGGN